MRRILDDSDLSEEEENRCPHHQVERVQIHAQPRDVIMDARSFMEDTAIPPALQPRQPGDNNNNGNNGVGRRHSMPMPMRTKELSTLLHHHRDSLPPVLEPRETKRRHSLPTKTLLNGTNIDKLTDKLTEVAEAAGSLRGSSSTLNSTLENLVVAAAAAGVSPRLSEAEIEGFLQKKVLPGLPRRKSEPERFSWRRASDTDYFFAQLQRAGRLYSSRQAWRDHGLSDIEQAALVRNLFNRRGSNGSLRTHSSNMSSFGRQVLRPLNSNSRVAPLNVTTGANGRQFGSGNEAFLLAENVAPAGVASIRGGATAVRASDVHAPDRPRSFSLDARLAEVQPQILQRLHEHVSGTTHRIFHFHSFLEA